MFENGSALPVIISKKKCLSPILFISPILVLYVTTTMNQIRKNWYRSRPCIEHEDNLTLRNPCIDWLENESISEGLTGRLLHITNTNTLSNIFTSVDRLCQTEFSFHFHSPVTIHREPQSIQFTRDAGRKECAHHAISPYKKKIDISYN